VSSDFENAVYFNEFNLKITMQIARWYSRTSENDNAIGLKNENHLKKYIHYMEEDRIM
jgi:hypothetical protein